GPAELGLVAAAAARPERPAREPRLRTTLRAERRRCRAVLHMRLWGSAVAIRELRVHELNREPLELGGDPGPDEPFGLGPTVGDRLLDRTLDPRVERRREQSGHEPESTSERAPTRSKACTRTSPPPAAGSARRHRR